MFSLFASRTFSKSAIIEPGETREFYTTIGIFVAANPKNFSGKAFQGMEYIKYNCFGNTGISIINFTKKGYIYVTNNDCFAQIFSYSFFSMFGCKTIDIIINPPIYETFYVGPSEKNGVRNATMEDEQYFCAHYVGEFSFNLTFYKQYDISSHFYADETEINQGSSFLVARDGFGVSWKSNSETKGEIYMMISGRKSLVMNNDAPYSRLDQFNCITIGQNNTRCDFNSIKDWKSSNKMSPETKGVIVGLSVSLTVVIIICITLFLCRKRILGKKQINQENTDISNSPPLESVHYHTPYNLPQTPTEIAPIYASPMHQQMSPEIINANPYNPAQSQFSMNPYDAIKI